MEEPAPAPAPVVEVKIEDVLPAKPADADEATAAAPIGLTRDAVFAKAKETGLTLVKQVKAESYGCVIYCAASHVSLAYSASFTALTSERCSWITRLPITVTECQLRQQNPRV